MKQQVYVDEAEINSQLLWKLMDIEYDVFIRYILRIFYFLLAAVGVI